MYQVTIFDPQGAVVKVELFSHQSDAISYMVTEALRSFISNQYPEGSTWQLSQRTRKGGLVPHRNLVR